MRHDVLFKVLRVDEGGVAHLATVGSFTGMNTPNMVLQKSSPFETLKK